MDQLMKLHMHPGSSASVSGFRLRSGDEILPGDVYNATNGEWRGDASLAGLVLGERTEAIWIRPSKLGLDPLEVLETMLTHAITGLGNVVLMGQEQQRDGRGNKHAMVLQGCAQHRLRVLEEWSQFLPDGTPIKVHLASVMIPLGLVPYKKE
ncbi:MAG TPA: hypothetical protein VI953_01545 [Candidatus Paceibacterota bacterium]